METGNVLKGRLLVKQFEAEKVTDGGIIIPDVNQEKPNTAKVVISAGEQVGVGDTVYFSDHAGTPVVLEEEALSLNGEFILLMETQVLFIKKEVLE